MKLKKFFFLILIVVMALSASACFTALPTPSPSTSPEATKMVVYRADTASSVSSVDSLADVIDGVHASVVEINCTLSTGTSAGSGVIFANNDADDTSSQKWVYLITNHHVIEGARAIVVRLVDGSEYSATLFASDAEGDIAVIGIKPSDGEDYDDFTYSTLPAATYNARVGDQVFAIGNPMGTLGGTVTTGIVSALDRFITVEDTPMLLMQTDAAINSGNSGGGLFNRAGQLIGIVNAKMKGTGIEGLGYAIPVTAAMDIVEQLFENGYVDRGMIGVSYAYIGSNDAMNEFLGQFYYRSGWGSTYFTDEESYNFWHAVFTDGRLEQYRYGIYVTDVSSASTDTQSKLKKGDFIVSVDGTAITSQTALTRVLYGKKTGDVVNVTVYRDGAVGQPVAITLIRKSA